MPIELSEVVSDAQSVRVLRRVRRRRRRRLLGLTQQQLALKVGIRFQQIQKYECGANRISAARLWQLAEALEDLSHGFENFPTGKITLPKAFADIRFLMTRFEPANELHQAMLGAFRQVFGERMAEHPIELTRAVEQSGRFLSSIYEIDYREMTRGTWRRARATFDQAYEEFKSHAIAAWAKLEDQA
mgnify:CR=1 FL=1